MPGIKHLFIPLLCGLVLLAHAVAAPAGNEVRIGVLAWHGAEEADIQWAAMMRELQQRLPSRRVVVRPFDIAGMDKALQAGELDFVVTNPGHYVVLEAANGVSRIATRDAAITRDGAHVVGSSVVVLASRDDLHTLADLRGRTLAAVSPDAFGGYQLAWAELRHHGVDPEAGDVRMLYPGFPMSTVLNAVLQGQADAGIVRACLLESLERAGTLPVGRLRVLAPRPEIAACQVTSPLYPGWAFAAARDTSPELSRSVLLALLSTPPDANGESWTVPADYYPVHQLFRELQIGPYAFLRETGLHSFARRYWPWLTSFGLALIGWIFYTLRVEYLVQRRTRQLSAALTERYRLEERVLAGQLQMEHLSRLSILGELAGTLAHELNQPLAAIGNYARSLLRRQQRQQLEPAALQQAAEEIASESERAAGILASIRAFARKRTRVRERRDLVQLVHEAASLICGMLAPAPAIEVRDRLDDTARWVEVDPLQIQQILLNLLKNAWDAQREAAVDPPIELTLDNDATHCRVCVRDHGIGMTAAQQEHLCEAFFTTKADGLGLGLSICKTIVEAHGGELGAETPADGRGLRFRFSLPRADVATAESRENA